MMRAKMTVMFALAASLVLAPSVRGGDLSPPVQIRMDTGPIDIQRTGHSAPFVGDFDRDGRLDILSGSWPGELYFFRRNPNGSFAKAELLKQRSGKNINVGSASTVFAADWDADGDLDLLVGAISGKVRLLRNESGGKRLVFAKPQELLAHLVAEDHRAIEELPRLRKAWAEAFREYRKLLADPSKPASKRSALLKQQREKVSKINAELARCQAAIQAKDQFGDSHPVAADWDGDGKLDLLIGHSEGGVVWCRNMGTTERPTLADPVELIPSRPSAWKKDQQRKPDHWGVRAKICVVDWNHDGRLDILLGDYCGGFTARPKQSSKELAEERRAIERLPELQKSLAAVSEKYRKLAKTSKPNQPDVDIQLNRLRAEIGRLEQEITRCRTVENKFRPQPQTHGYVWLFLRKESGN